MRTRLELDMRAQPNDTTCGPTCLHAVYRYWGKPMSLDAIIAETGRLEGGGTLASILGCHALRRGFEASLTTFNLNHFDPTWFPRAGGPGDPVVLAEKLKSRRTRRAGRKARTAVDAYLDFLELGGEVRMEDLTEDLIRGYLRRELPILTGLSATYLYGCPREVEAGPDELEYDDVNGDPVGHFVVLTGYDRTRQLVHVADPLSPTPESGATQYPVSLPKLICAILVGLITYDGNLLVIRPASDRTSAGGARRDGHAHSRRG